MLTKDYYDIIDNELENIIINYKDLETIKQQNKIEGKKSVAFLLWFLEKYAPGNADVVNSIVEGNDDSSCDIIYKHINCNDEEVFYVVQAKWFNKNKINVTNKVGKEIKACLSDFELILRGEKKLSSVNEKFNEKYKALVEHKQKNMKIEFIFLFLCQDTSSADENINMFKSNLVGFKKMDIEKLKRDYIRKNYMNLKSIDPIEAMQKPISKIDLEIESKNFLKVEKPYLSYIFLIKPKLVFNLYEKYGDSLFYDNIRNPLKISRFNDSINLTLKDEPSNFWFYNNGLTAITDKIHDFHFDNEIVSVDGIQIINGAQTLSSIYNTYQKMDGYNRKKIDEEVKISLRIMKSGGKDHDFKVTKYTNSQNPVINRDFHSNDKIQSDLQTQFFQNTNIWYERRRGEFKSRGLPKNILKISNETLAQIYLSYSLQEPLLAKNNKKKIFISQKEDSKNGLYERIFNEKCDYKEMEASYYLYQYIESKKKEYNKKYKKLKEKEVGKFSKNELEFMNKSFVLHGSFHFLALMKIKLLEKTTKSKALNGIIKSNCIKRDFSNLDEVYDDMISEITTFIIRKMETDSTYTDSKYFKSSDCFKELKTII